MTGLIVIDTGSDLTWFGQLVVMTLIQLGGLGLMTFAVFVLSALGLPVGLTHKMFFKEDLNQTSISELLRLVAVILRVVLVCEAIGVAALACVFVPDLGWRSGLWNALFHAISAFNNAGFALYPDSLTRWATDPLINLIVPALFEVASAFGTVGLSRGETGELDALGRAVIMAIMFIGRVEPLTLGFFLATRSIPRIRYPEGRSIWAEAAPAAAPRDGTTGLTQQTDRRTSH